ncbi:MAG: helix-turn-helix transcriptional regulator [Spirosomataceae bacterium]
MKVADNIKSIRKSKGITQVEIAEKLGIGQSNYTYLENRGEKLTIEQLESIAGALGVSVVELLTGEPQKVQEDERVEELENKLRLQERLLLFFQNAENSINNQYALMFIDDAWVKMRVEKIPPELEIGYTLKYNFDIEEEIEKFINEKVISDDIGKALVNGGLVRKESLLRSFNRFKNTIPSKYKVILDNYLRSLLNPD